MKPSRFKPALLALTPLCLAMSMAQADPFTVTLEQPDHGRISVHPALPPDGRVEAGTTLRATVEAEAGYRLDTLYTAVPGRWGFAYNESMQPALEFTVDQDMTLSALLLEADRFDGFTFRDNIVYAQPGVKPLKYDVWSPVGAEDLPLVVIIHGGGWTSNTEDIMRGMAREIVRTGRYVVASLDYRWAGTGDGDARANDMADLINDVFGGIAHIREHAAGYGADPDRIAVTGDSAGGHLAAVAATMPGMIGDGGFGERDGVFEFMPSYLPAGTDADQLRRELQAAIRVAAPSYGVFAPPAEGMAGLNQMSDDPDADADWTAAIAPINHVPPASERAVPHYFVRGTEDMLIRDAMVQDYTDALEAQGQQVRYDQVEGANHAFFDWKPDATTRETFARFGVPYVKEMVGFFDGVFYP